MTMMTHLLFTLFAALATMSAAVDLRKTNRKLSVSSYG